MKPDNIILEGVTGSTAYGLNTENSDVDIKGVYLLPVKRVLEMGFNQNHTTIDHTDPDWVYHEVGKFMNLVSGGNPTLTELLFLEEYTVLTPVGRMLVDNRDAFLSTKAISNAYRGYAFSQAKKLNNRTEQGLESYDSGLKNRFAKHSRHLYRLLLQAEELLTTGTLTVKLTQKQREACFALGEKTASEVVDYFVSRDKEIEALSSVLPDQPDYEKLNDILYQIRMMK